MSKHLIGLILLLSLAAPARAQDQEADDAPATDETVAVEDAGETAAPEDIDDEDLDLQTYEEDEDDFVPTEEIPADEPIPFPSNI